MKPWKPLLGVGVGAACAACCAVPLLGGASAALAGTGALAAFGAALMACANELLALLLATAVGAGVWAWRRRRLQRQREAAAASRPACRVQPAQSGCRCEPGACG